MYGYTVPDLDEVMDPTKYCMSINMANNMIGAFNEVFAILMTPDRTDLDSHMNAAVNTKSSITVIVRRSRPSKAMGVKTNTAARTICRKTTNVFRGA